MVCTNWHFVCERQWAELNSFKVCSSSLLFSSHQLFGTYRSIYVWIYENEAKGLKSLTKRASFFSSPETLPLYLAFTAVLSLFLARLHGLKAASKFSEIQVKLISRTKRAFFFSPETISKGDDIKIKRIVSPFFLPLPLYLAFTAVLSLFLARLHGLEVALEFRELKVKKEF